MKIKEVISEDLPKDVGDVTQLSVNNVSKGANAVNKLFSPGQWFKDKNIEKDKPEQSQQAPVKKTSPHLFKASLVNAASGSELYRDDLVRLQQLSSKYQQGSAEADALTAASKQQPLDKNQKQILLNLSKKY
jgi:hypothetical protein